MIIVWCWILGIFSKFCVVKYQCGAWLLKAATKYKDLAEEEAKKKIDAEAKL